MTRRSTPVRGALALELMSLAEVPPEAVHMSHAEAVELLRRAARIVRAEAFADCAPSSPRRTERLAESRSLEALAANLAAFTPDVRKLNLAMQRAIEMAIQQIDEQVSYGVPREHQQVHYARIFADVRGELAELERSAPDARP
jgi:hypothetical protein